MTAATGGPDTSAFGHLHLLRIDRLSPPPDPTTKSPVETYIEAVIALIWPFSSSTETLSLLLADPDVRQRKSKGQVRVTFQGLCAREVAGSQLGIGDSVKLSLEGAEWILTGETVSTPGRKIGWDLVFRKRVILEIGRAATRLALVDFKENTDLSPTRNGYHPRGNHLLQSGKIDHNVDTLFITFPSPAFVKSARQPSGSFLDASLDPFVEDDGFVVGKGRKRTKFSRHSGSWRLLDDSSDSQNGAKAPSDAVSEDNAEGPDVESGSVHAPEQRISPSPIIALLDIDTTDDPGLINGRLEQEVEFPQQPDHLVHQEGLEIHDSFLPDAEEIGEAAKGEPINVDEPDSPGVMPPPRTPTRRLPAALASRLHGTESLPTISSSPATITPRLNPLPSPGLPLVSPLIQRQGAMTGYFPDQPSQLSELEASGGLSQIQQNIGTWAETESETQSVDFLVSPVGDAAPSHIPSETQYWPVQSIDVDGGMGSPRDPGEIDTFLQLHPPSGTVLDTSLGSVSHVQHANTMSPKYIEVSDNDEYPATADSTHTDFNQTLLEIESGSAPLQGLTNTFEDDEMYGPSGNVEGIDKTLQFSPVTDRDEYVNTADSPQDLPTISDAKRVASLEDQPPTSWEAKLSVSALECTNDQSGPLSAPPFPFRQNWDKPRSRSRQSTEWQKSYDGAGDLRQEKKGSIRESDSAELASVISVGLIEGNVESTRNEQILLQADFQEKIHEALITEGRRGSADGVITTVMEDEGPSTATELEISEPVSDLKAADHLIELPEVFEESRATPDRSTRTLQSLPTPENTQQDQNTIPQTHEVFPKPIKDQAMPPTPQNTQETSLTTETDFTTAKPSQPNSEIVEVTRAPLPSHPIGPRSSRRLSRKSFTLKEISEISSPYFTPRQPGRTRSTQQPLSPSLKENSALKKVSTVETLTKEVFFPEMTRILDLDDSEERSPISPVASFKPTSLTTPMSYYATLSKLSDHFSQSIDILAACTTSSEPPKRAKAGPRDFHCTLHLVDSSMVGNNTVTAQVFRPHKSALPAVQRGDIVLLRSFKVQSSERKCMLLSTETSAWTVFTHPQGRYNKLTKFDINMSGPPVEYGREEIDHVRDIMKWWDAKGVIRYPPLKDVDGEDDADSVKGVNNDQITKGDEITPPRRSGRRRTNFTDHIGNGGEDDHPINPPPRRTPRRQSDVSLIVQQPPKRSGERSRRSESLVHELRDGTTWIDDDNTSVRSRRSRRSGSVVHELRDGATYVDE